MNTRLLARDSNIFVLPSSLKHLIPCIFHSFVCLLFPIACTLLKLGPTGMAVVTRPSYSLTCDPVFPGTNDEGNPIPSDPGPKCSSADIWHMCLGSILSRQTGIRVLAMTLGPTTSSMFKPQAIPLTSNESALFSHRAKFGM